MGAEVRGEVYLTKKCITELLVRSCENSHGVASQYVMTQNLCSAAQRTQDCSSAVGSRRHNGLCFPGTENSCHRVMRFFSSGVLILVRLVTIARLAACQSRQNQLCMKDTQLNSWGQPQDTVTLMKLPNMGAIGRYEKGKHKRCLCPPPPPKPDSHSHDCKGFLCLCPCWRKTPSLN